MKINVRKARRIEQQLEHLVADHLPMTETISIFGTNIPDMDRVLDDLKKDVINRDIYNRIRFNIRDLIATYNHDSGLNGLMAEEARIKSSYAMYLILASTTPRNTMSQDSIRDEIDSTKIRYANSHSSYGHPSVTVPVMDKATVDEYISMSATLRKQQSDISDKMLELNISGTIDLNDDMASVLQELQFI